MQASPSTLTGRGAFFAFWDPLPGAAIAPVGTAAIGGLGAAVQVLATACARGMDIASLQPRFEARREAAQQYDASWRRYAWSVDSLDDLKLAPFHLRHGGCGYDGKDHAWHMRTLAEICEQDPAVLQATMWREVDLADDEDRASVVS
jgi:protein phosphatase